MKLFLRRRIGARYGTIPLHTGKELKQLQDMAREQLKIEKPEQAVEFLIHIACAGGRAAPLAVQKAAPEGSAAGSPISGITWPNSTA